ncbi:hypothetical protein LCGC14_2257540 [marine sediment metagenome]|uniref:Uncharacterized protein n=1 Tax=marine sediment metagenome TaxID=412755 RepID=A0A0F9D0J5_9ZZZZ
MAWDKDKPASTSSLAVSNPEILANWDALQTAIGAQHDFDGSTQSGEHVYNITVAGGATTSTKVFTKYITGSLDADDSTDVTHGISGIDNILSVTVCVFEDQDSLYRVSDFRGAAEDANRSFQVSFSATVVRIGGVGTKVQGNKFRIRIDYVVP